YLGKSVCVRFLVILDRDLSRHAAHGVDTSSMTGLDAKQRIRTHEMGGHRHQSAVGQNKLGIVPESFNAAKNVIPPATIQARRVFPQLIKNLVHLKSGENRFD